MTDDKPALESASFLQSVLEAMPLFVVLLDDSERIRYINRLRPGLTRDQIIGRSTFDFVAPEYHEVHRRSLDAARTQGGEHSYLVKAANLQGAPGYFETRAIGVDRPGGGRDVYVAAVEVTEHVAQAEALRESEAQLRLAVEATGIGLWVWDATLDTIEWSPRMLEITGQSEALNGEDYAARCVHPEDRAMMVDEIGKLQHQGMERFVVHRIVRPDGETRWVAPVGQLTFDDAGKLVRIRGGMLDITAQRQTEEQLRQMQKVDAVGGLTAGVAHNFNNVLAVILPAIETALADPAIATESPTRRRLQDAGEAARRAANLVSQLMTSVGQREPQARTAVDLHGLLQSLVSMCRQTFDRQCRIELECERVPPPVHGDAAALEQVFLNLMMNARDALSTSGQPEPRIQVQLTQRGGNPSGGPCEAHVVVRDNGPGMTEAVRSRLFEPFLTTKPPGQGTGLGLATSLATVRGHGGHIDIRSELGHGTTCEVVLPCMPDASSSVVAETAPIAPSARRSRILLVDDEAAIRSVMRQLLESVGHEVADVASAEQAVERIQAGYVPELVLLDRSMPGWPVHRAITEIRAHAGSAAIVLFTGQGVPEDEAALVDGVLYKPMTVEELHQAIARFARAPG